MCNEVCMRGKKKGNLGVLECDCFLRPRSVGLVSDSPVCDQTPVLLRLSYVIMENSI